MTETLQTTCCVVGGGPAGIMLGYLLARAGVAVTVLEKHQDFFRDFRGDTVHPSTLELMYELGFLEDFLKVPHQELASTGGVFGDFSFQAVSFRHVPTHCKFMVLMPQWDFLDFLSARAKGLPHFQLLMDHRAVGLLRDSGRITGVEVATPEGSRKIRADLVVGCDGRHSTLREAASMEVRDFGVPIDVLWFRISRKASDPERLLGNFNYGKALILINRGDYFQAGFIVRKGFFDEMQRHGLPAFRQNIAQIVPCLRDRMDELQNWDQVKLLSVQINRLNKWHQPGLLCIGDAAHAMSPVGGVGINLAIQDAVAAANLLARPLREGNGTDGLLARIQRRRMFPTRITQSLQVVAHERMRRIFTNPGPLHAPWQLKLALRIPGLRTAMGYLVGIGIRPEHVQGGRNPSASNGCSLKGVAVCAGLATAIAVAAVRIFKKNNYSVPPKSRESQNTSSGVEARS